MRGSDQVGHSNVCKPMTKWDTLMCDPPIEQNSDHIFKPAFDVTLFHKIILQLESVLKNGWRIKINSCLNIKPVTQFHLDGTPCLLI